MPTSKPAVEPYNSFGVGQLAASSSAGPDRPGAGQRAAAVLFCSGSTQWNETQVKDYSTRAPCPNHLTFWSSHTLTTQAPIYTRTRPPSLEANHRHTHTHTGCCCCCCDELWTILIHHSSVSDDTTGCARRSRTTDDDPEGGDTRHLYGRRSASRQHELEAQDELRQMQRGRGAGAADPPAGPGRRQLEGHRGLRAAGLRGGAGRRRRGAGGAGGGGRARAGTALRAGAAGHGGAGVRVRPEGRAADPLRRRRVPPRRRRRQPPVVQKVKTTTRRTWWYVDVRTYVQKVTNVSMIDPRSLISTDVSCSCIETNVADVARSE